MGVSHQAASGRRHIGEALVDRAMITEAELRDAVVAQESSGARLGTVLITAGLVSRLDLYQVMAEEWGVPFIDLTTIDFDEPLLERFSPQQLAEESWFPVRGQWEDGILATGLEADRVEPFLDALI